MVPLAAALTWARAGAWAADSARRDSCGDYACSPCRVASCSYVSLPQAANRWACILVHAAMGRWQQAAWLWRMCSGGSWIASWVSA